jgi:hypothetical protein
MKENNNVYSRDRSYVVLYVEIDGACYVLTGTLLGQMGAHRTVGAQQIYIYRTLSLHGLDRINITC